MIRSRKVSASENDPVSYFKGRENNKEIEVGKIYSVKKRDGVWAPGEVIYKRLSKKKKGFEYYISYLNMEKRLDEWVQGHRIRQSSVAEIPICVNGVDDQETDLDVTDGALDFEEREQKELTKVKFIQMIQFGFYEIETWYYSPYPLDYVDKDKLFICTKCFKYMQFADTYISHMDDCDFSHPPGRIAYQKNDLAIFEVDGSENLLYCQNLSLLGKLFIDHKTVHYDVGTFLFYILCCFEDEKYIIRGFFSKEKDLTDRYNVSCILTLPPFQNQGFGKLLIDFSYKLSVIEGLPGSPEEPLSDLCLIAYESYWTWVIITILLDAPSCITLADLSVKTGISEGDIIHTLKCLKCLDYWKGSTKICIQPDKISSIVSSGKFKVPRLTIDSSCILL